MRHHGKWKNEKPSGLKENPTSGRLEKLFISDNLYDL